MGPTDTEKYGNGYWVVKTNLSKSGEIRLLADEIVFLPNGGIMFQKSAPNENSLAPCNLALSSGNWSAIYKASMFDGHPVAVDHWDGELVEKK